MARASREAERRIFCLLSGVLNTRIEFEGLYQRCDSKGIEDEVNNEYFNEDVALQNFLCGKLTNFCTVT